MLKVCVEEYYSQDETPIEFHILHCSAKLVCFYTYDAL